MVKRNWGSDADYNVEMALAESAGIHQHRHSWHDDASNGDVMDSVAYVHIALQVPFLSIGLIGLLIIESSQGQLCSGRLGRVESTPFCVCKLDTNTSLSTSSCSECEKCKQSATGKAKGLVRDILASHNEVEFIGDSGASATFTYDLSDFTEYHELNISLEARTANKGVPLQIKGSGTVFLKHKVSKGHTVTIRLDPVYYIPGLLV